MRKLTPEEIKTLANRGGVKGTVVENFLNTVCNNETVEEARSNLLLDSHLYGWDFFTYCAISDGIRLAKNN